MDRQLLRQKSHQKFSVMKTKKLVFSEKYVVCFGILIHVEDNRNTSVCFHYWDFFTNFWRNNWRSIFDVVERLLLRIKKTYTVSTSFARALTSFPHENVTVMTRRTTLWIIFCPAFTMSWMINTWPRFIWCSWKLRWL